MRTHRYRSKPVAYYAIGVQPSRSSSNGTRRRAPGTRRSTASHSPRRRRYLRPETTISRSSIPTTPSSRTASSQSVRSHAESWSSSTRSATTTSSESLAPAWPPHTSGSSTAHSGSRRRSSPRRSRSACTRCATGSRGGVSPKGPRSHCFGSPCGTPGSSARILNRPRR